jgi:hypothetical protein
VLEDSLQGETKGELRGGELTEDGFAATEPQGQQHVFYELPAGITHGYIEFEVTGVSNDSGGPGGDPAFLGMYDGRGVEEPAEYFRDFKNNYFRLVLLYRQNRQGIKGVVNTAADTPERRSAEYAVFEGERDWSNEPTGRPIEWDPDTWYTIRLTWGPDGYSATRDGSGVWGSHAGPNAYAPAEPRLWIGAAPGYGDKYTNAGPEWRIRNLKVVDLTGSSDDQ